MKTVARITFKHGKNPNKSRIQKIGDCWKEFAELKAKLFAGNMFVVLDEHSEEVKRYNQLLQYFYPSLRTKDFIHPIDN